MYVRKFLISKKACKKHFQSMRKVCLQPLFVNIGNRWLQNKTAFCDTKRANNQHIANGGYKRYFFLLPAKIQYHRGF